MNAEQQKLKKREPVGYIRKEIPRFELPDIEGERYDAMVPDTLDLQERAALAVNVLTGATDPEADYEIYFSVDIRRNPPMMDHNYSDHCQNKFIEALPLMRMVSGCRENLEVDRIWIESALRCIGPYGMFHYPLQGRPWALHGPWFAMRGGQEDKVRQRGYILSAFFTARLLSGMVNYSRHKPAAWWRDEICKLVDGLAHLAVDRGDYAFFAPQVGHAEPGFMESVGDGTTAEDAWVALGLVHAYRATGYEPAIVLARKILNNVINEFHCIEPDGVFGPVPSRHAHETKEKRIAQEVLTETLRENQGVATAEAVLDYMRPDYQHFHTHTYVLLAVLEYALVTGDNAWLELVRRGFEYGKADGNVLLGYFPEMLGRPNFETSELCEVADMVALGIKLSVAGVGDYWDDVDRWARNMFAEGQLTPARAALLKRFVDSLPVTPVDHDKPVSGGVTPSGYETTNRVIERNIGGFAGWPSPNEWGTAIMHCCTGNGARSIYYLWDNILNHNGGKLKVNLLLNRASPWADIDSHLPYTGQVDVKVKKRVDLEVRIPEWVRPEEVLCMVDGMKHELTFDGRYARVGAVKAGQTVTLTFPNPERRESVWIEKHRYTLYLKGNTVVEIDPPGATIPLFQRANYRENVTRWRKIERFISKVST